MALWELLPEFNWSQEVLRRFCVPPTTTTYGSVKDQYLKPPQVSWTFTAKGITMGEILSIISTRNRGLPYMLTDKNGDDHTGSILNLVARQIDGTIYYQVTIQLRI